MVEVEVALEASALVLDCRLQPVPLTPLQSVVVGLRAMEQVAAPVQIPFFPQSHLVVAVVAAYRIYPPEAQMGQMVVLAVVVVLQIQAVELEELETPHLHHQVKEIMVAQGWINPAITLLVVVGEQVPLEEQPGLMLALEETEQRLVFLVPR